MGVNWSLIFKLGGAALGGAAITGTVGHYVHKAEMDKAEEQIRALQQQNAKLISLLLNKDKQIERIILKSKIAAIEADINEMNDQKLKVMLRYAIKDYAEIFIKKTNNDIIYENDAIFFAIMDNLIEGRDITNSNWETIKKRINLKYALQLERLIDPDLVSLISKLC